MFGQVFYHIYMNCLVPQCDVGSAEILQEQSAADRQETSETCPISVVLVNHSLEVSRAGISDSTPEKATILRPSCPPNRILNRLEPRSPSGTPPTNSSPRHVIVSVDDGHFWRATRSLSSGFICRKDGLLNRT